MSRAATIVMGLVVAVLVSLGLLWDAQGFTANMLAELAGVLTSVLLAILVVDQLIKRERHRQNEGLRGVLAYLMRGFLGDISYVCSGYFSALPPGLIDKSYVLDPLDSIGDWADWVREHFDLLAKPVEVEPIFLIVRKKKGGWSTRGGFDKPAIYYVSHESEIGQIQETRARALLDLESSDELYRSLQLLHERFVNQIVPRALNVASESALIQAVIEAENHWALWRQAIDLVVHDWGAPGEMPWGEFLGLLEALQEIERIIQASPSRDPENSTVNADSQDADPED